MLVNVGDMVIFFEEGIVIIKWYGEKVVKEKVV